MVYLRETSSKFRKGTAHLQHEYASTNAPSTNLATFLTTDSHIIRNGKELRLDAGSFCFLGSHSKVQNVTSVIHGDD